MSKLYYITAQNSDSEYLEYILESAVAVSPNGGNIDDGKVVNCRVFLVLWMRINEGKWLSAGDFPMTVNESDYYRLKPISYMSQDNSLPPGYRFTAY